MTVTARLTRVTDGLRRVNPWVWDVLLGVFIVAASLAVLFGHDEGDEAFRDSDVFAVVLTVGAGVSVVWRRRFPLEALVAGSSFVVVLTVLEYKPGATPTVILVLLYAAGHYATRARAQFGLLVGMAALGIVAAARPPELPAADVATTAVLFVVSWVFGTAVRHRNETLLQRAVEAERRAEITAERDARALAEERLRIAQELHDVVAHTMSVIAVQAGVGAHVIDRDPVEAKRALENISATSRSSLTELRRLLGVLRSQDGTPVAHAPAPGLSDLPALAAQVSAAGVPVDLRVEDGTGASAPEGVNLTVYRIVQEALTNVIKHAGPARAWVNVCHEPGAVSVEVADDGRGPSANGGLSESGHGLTGMRERVAVYGGSIDSGPRPGGGFRVRARIPYETVT